MAQIVSSLGDVISVSDLKRRGWTLTLIRRHLGEPDDRAKNPHYATGSPMLLYMLSRVEAAEAMRDGQAALEKGKHHGLVSKSAGITKKSKLFDDLGEFDIEIEIHPERTLLRLAIAEHNAQLEQWQWTNEYDVSLKSETWRINEVVVEFLRRMHAESTDLFDRIKGKTGATEARRLIHVKVLDAIAAQYLFLREECERQKAKLYPLDPLDDQDVGPPSQLRRRR